MRETIVLDLQKPSDEYSSAVKMRVRRGDSRSLSRTFQIMNGGEPVNLIGKVVTFMARNAGGNVIMEAVDASDASGQFTYRLPTAVAAAVGVVTLAYFRVESNDDADEWVASTNQMFIEVLGDVSLTDDVTGDYVPLLDQIMEAAEEHEANASTLAAAATEAVNSCGEATAAANAATTAANSAAKAANDAANAANACVDAYEQAENSRDEAYAAAEAARDAANSGIWTVSGNVLCVRHYVGTL